MEVEIWGMEVIKVLKIFKIYLNPIPTGLFGAPRCWGGGHIVPPHNNF